MKVPSFLNQQLALAATTIGYVVAGKIGLAYAVVNASASAIWMPTGIALATLLLAGRKSWPWIFLGALLVNLTTAGTFSTSLGVACGNTGEAVFGSWLIQKYAGGVRTFGSPRDIFIFLPLAILAASISATIGVGSLLLGGFINGGHFELIWSTWCLGDVIGAVIACPFLMLWINGGLPQWNMRQTAEAIAITLVLFLLGGWVFAGFGSTKSSTLAFICPLPVLWAALRLGGREAMTATVLLMILAIYGTQHGHGPFTPIYANESLVLLQSFIGITGVMGLLVSAVVGERNRFEGELKIRNLELARSNQELEQFAYVAAHDLQEPIRMIITFLQIIQHRTDEHLDEKTREHMSMVTSSAARMQNMVRSILDYSLLGKSTIHTATCDTDAAAKQALLNLHDQVVDAKAEIEIIDLPRKIVGDQSQLIRLFQNLISNAIKFRSERHLHVRITAVAESDAWVFSVADNGIGIPLEATAKLFGLFQRVHSREKYPGTGIGLASCKKIVELHSGRIWFDSILDQGTTFKFCVPNLNMKPGSVAARTPVPASS